MDTTEVTSAILANILAALPALIPIFYTLLAAAGLDLLSGVIAAKLSGTFNGEYVPSWIKSHGDSISKILLIALAGVAVGGTDNVAGDGLLILALGNATTYLTGVVSSIAGNVTAARTKTKGAPSSVAINAGKPPE